MKKSILFFVFSILIISANAQKLENVILDILKLANEKNIKEINSNYVNEEYGVYDVYRIGVTDRFRLLNKIPDYTNEWSIYHTIVNVKDDDKKLSRMDIKYDCDNNIWCFRDERYRKKNIYTKKGVFYNQILEYPLLSEIMNYETNKEGREFSQKEVEKIEYIESNSVRVVDIESEFIFYLTKINQKWHLTLIDRVTTDCSY